MDYREHSPDFEEAGTLGGGIGVGGCKTTPKAVATATVMPDTARPGTACATASENAPVETEVDNAEDMLVAAVADARPAGHSRML